MTTSAKGSRGCCAGQAATRMRRQSLRCLGGDDFLLLGMFLHVEEEEADADADGAVGDVERGPVVVADVEVEEVDDVAEAEAVEEVADGAAADGGQRGLEHGGRHGR